MDAQAAKVVAVREESGVGDQAARRDIGVQLGHPRPDAVGIEHLVPRRLERVGDIDPSAVAADLHHLRPATQRQIGRHGMRPASHDPAEADRAISRGWNGSLTSYCLSSPVPQQDTYSQWSSTDRSMSETSGGTAPNGCRAGGRSSASAGSAGMVITLSIAHLSPLGCHSHTDADRSSTLMTTPTKPNVLAGSWAGRSSSTI